MSNPVPLGFIVLREAAEPVYLGDGAYVQFDGYNIWLLANSHNPAMATDKVGLGPSTIRNLIDYIERFWIVPKRV